MVGFKDQNFSIGFDSLMAALDKNPAAILGPLLELAGPASYGMEECHKVGWIYGMLSAQQFVAYLAQRFSPCEAIKLLGAPVPVDDAFLRMPDENRLE